MECTNCSLINQLDRILCDCGHNFKKGLLIIWLFRDNSKPVISIKDLKCGGWVMTWYPTFEGGEAEQPLLPNPDSFVAS